MNKGLQKYISLIEGNSPKIVESNSACDREYYPKMIDNHLFDPAPLAVFTVNTTYTFKNDIKVRRVCETRYDRHDKMVYQKVEYGFA